MEYTKIKEWMDKLVDNINGRKVLKDFNNRIMTAQSDDVLVYEGIDIMASVVGKVLKEEKVDCTAMQYRYSFEYRGINFETFERQRRAGYEEAEGC